MKAKKILIDVGASLLVLGGAAYGTCKIFGNRNAYIMNSAVMDGMEQVMKNYKVRQLNAGEFENLRFYGIMKFHTDQYHIEDLGNLSVMTADMGFMQMVSFVITPFEKNMPVCSMDFMYIFGTRKSYVEFYDLVGDTQTEEYKNVIKQLEEVKTKYSDLTEIETKDTWYNSLLSVAMHKEISGDDADSTNSELFLDVLTAYLDASKALPVSSAEDQAEQLKNTQAYCYGLITNGGVSTDVFKKLLGEEKTTDFFNKVFFGTMNYRNGLLP